MKKVLSVLTALAMVFALCATSVLAGPPAPPTKEADTYTGPVIEYPDKELWFDSTVYHGFTNLYQIVAGNGSEGFDIDAFINSKLGEQLINRARYEMALLGDDQYASQTMIDYWAEQGVIETAYNSDDPEHEWLAYMPDYMTQPENADKVYPVVFSYHGNGGSLFEATNHGFVHLCYEKQFIVICPENENCNAELTSNGIAAFIDELVEKGYPVDRSRVYVTGHSNGGRTAIWTAMNNSDIIAAVGNSGSIRVFNPSANSAGTFVITDEMFAANDCADMPLYIQVGEYDYAQIPLTAEGVHGFNNFLAMNGLNVGVQADNKLGITADRIYEQEVNGANYTFAEYDNADGITTVRFGGVEGLPHWAGYSFAELAWDFMKQWSIVDGQRVYTKASYSDVDPSDSYAAAVEAVTEADLMNGTGGNCFSPELAVTRSQAITVLGRLAGAQQSETGEFTDIEANSWYSGYVGWAVENGIVQGDGEGHFFPDEPVTGEHLDLMLTRYAQGKGLDYINFPAYENRSPAPVTRGTLAQRLVKLMNAPVAYDYPEKELWFDGTIYGGFYSAYQIVMGNGSAGFDMPAFVNSKQGEQLLRSIKYELILLGDDKYASDTMVNHWEERGIILTDHNADDPEHEWLTYVPDYMTKPENAGKVYPVVIDYHGGGTTLFESTDHGFVDICYEKQFIVVCPESEDSNAQLTSAGIGAFIDELVEKGYPVDRSRVYLSGMSNGGRTAIWTAMNNDDIIAAVADSGSIRVFNLDPSANGPTTFVITDEMFEEAACAGMPLYIQIGEYDNAQIPLTSAGIDGFNKFLAMNGLKTGVAADNSLGITSDRIYQQEFDDTTYTFAEYDNADGVTIVKFAGVEGMPHWISPYFAELAWDFLSQWSIVDGQRVYSK